MPVKRLLLFLATLLAACETNATLPAPFTAWYSLHAKGLTIGTMERRLEVREDGRYHLRSESRTAGLIALIRNDRILEESTWTLENDQIRPMEYSYQYSGSKKPRTVKVHFDWKQGKIINQEGDSTWHMAIVPGVMDKLVYQLGIMADLKRGKRRLEYRIADGGKIKTYPFDYLGEEALDLPLGKFQTLKFEYHKANSPRKTTVWCAPALDYLPVRLDYRERDGTVISALLEKVSGIPAR